MRVISEGPTRITRTAIEAAWKRRQTATRLLVRDVECRGLVLVVNPTGMAWRLDWRPRGSDPVTGRRWAMQSRVVGNPASHSPDDARREASALKGRAKSGVDLAVERRKQIADASRQRAATAERLLEAYQVDLPKRPKLRGTGVVGVDYAANEIAHLRRAVAAMGVVDRPVVEITPAAIGRMLTALADQPATARKHFGTVSRFLDYAVDRGHIDLNPCARLPKGQRPRAVPSRPNCPSLSDLAAIWFGLAVLGDAERDLVRWLMAVPCRLSEGTHLEWPHVDWANARINLPGAMTKTGEPHRVHLHALALDLLHARHQAAGKPVAGLVFPSPRAALPIMGYTKIKRRASVAAGVTGWTFHDFRRSFASACAELGVSESVCDAVLSHKQAATRAGVLGVYQRSTRWPEQVAAMNCWGAALQGAVIGLASRP